MIFCHRCHSVSDQRQERSSVLVHKPQFGTCYGYYPGGSNCQISVNQKVSIYDGYSQPSQGQFDMKDIGPVK